MTQKFSALFIALRLIGSLKLATSICLVWARQIQINTPIKEGTWSGRQWGGREERRSSYVDGSPAAAMGGMEGG